LQIMRENNLRNISLTPFETAARQYILAIWPSLRALMVSNSKIGSLSQDRSIDTDVSLYMMNVNKINVLQDPVEIKFGCYWRDSNQSFRLDGQLNLCHTEKIKTKREEREVAIMANVR